MLSVLRIRLLGMILFGAAGAGLIVASLRVGADADVRPLTAIVGLVISAAITTAISTPKAVARVRAGLPFLPVKSEMEPDPSSRERESSAISLGVGLSILLVVLTMERPWLKSLAYSVFAGFALSFWALQVMDLVWRRHQSKSNVSHHGLKT